MIGLIYKIENKVNGKVYIGITRNGISGRYPGRSWKVSNARSRLVKKAMTKYGADNFEISIIEECNIDLLEEREKYYVETFNSFVPNGYNLTRGGEYNKVVSAESRKRNSATNKGRPSWNKGVPLSVQRKLEHSNKMKGRTPWNKGKKTGKMTEEAIKNSTRAHYKAVNCFNLQGDLIKVYESLVSTRADGFDPSQVSSVCKGKTKTHRNYKFEYVS
jgi:group I intron endonuclease